MPHVAPCTSENGACIVFAVPAYRHHKLDLCAMAPRFSCIVSFLLELLTTHDFAIQLRPHYILLLRHCHRRRRHFLYLLRTSTCIFLITAFEQANTTTDDYARVLAGGSPFPVHPSSPLRFTIFEMSEHRNIHKQWRGKTLKLLLLYKFVHSTKKEKETMKYPNTCSLSGM